MHSRVVNLLYSSKSFVCRFKLFNGSEKRVRNVLQVTWNKLRHPRESAQPVEYLRVGAHDAYSSAGSRIEPWRGTRECHERSSQVQR